MSSISQRLDRLIAAGEALTAAGVPILPIKTSSKMPIPNPADGSWWTIDDPDDVAPVFVACPEANLAMLCGRAKESPILVVDIDGKSGLAKAQALGVTSGSDCWVARTGGGD